MNFEDWEKTIDTSITGDISAEQREQIRLYWEKLQEQNQIHNLVSPKSIQESLDRHFKDSLYIVSFCKQHIEERVVYDLGSGAGFPGLIFAILNPQKNILLTEKINKKRDFLNSMIQELGLKNLATQKSFPDKISPISFILNRAVKPYEELFLFLQNKIVKRSRWIVCLGGDNDLPDSSTYQILEKKRYFLSNEVGFRKLVICEKN